VGGTENILLLTRLAAVDITPRPTPRGFVAQRADATKPLGVGRVVFRGEGGSEVNSAAPLLWISGPPRRNKFVAADLN